MSKKYYIDRETEKLGLNTRLTHLGHNPRDYHGFVNPPVVHASTVLFPNHESMGKSEHPHKQPYTYGIHGTPTTDALCDALSALENAHGTILVPSGLAAISASILSFAETGMHMLLVDSTYSPTRRFCSKVLSRLGVEVEYFDPLIGEGLAELMRPNTGIVMLEAPASNSFEMCDVPLLSAIAHDKNKKCVVMMDNTWATPLYFKPLDHGVDISIHALTKYPGGHSDVMMGSVSANASTWDRLSEAHTALGNCAAPDDSYLILRGLRTMGVRLAHHAKSTMEICRWLQNQEKVSRVLYPALPEDPGYDLWSRDFSGASGLFSFVLKGADRDEAGKFLNALQIHGLGYSWAGFESLAIMPVFSDRVMVKGPQGGTAIRIQVGLEDAEDLIADLDRGLNTIS